MKYLPYGKIAWSGKHLSFESSFFRVHSRIQINNYICRLSKLKRINPNWIINEKQTQNIILPSVIGFPMVLNCLSNSCQSLANIYKYILRFYWQSFALDSWSKKGEANLLEITLAYLWLVKLCLVSRTLSG